MHMAGGGGGDTEHAFKITHLWQTVPSCSQLGVPSVPENSSFPNLWPRVTTPLLGDSPSWPRPSQDQSCGQWFCQTHSFPFVVPIVLFQPPPPPPILPSRRQEVGLYCSWKFRLSRYSFDTEKWRLESARIYFLLLEWHPWVFSMLSPFSNSPVPAGPNLLVGLPILICEGECEKPHFGEGQI